MKILIVSDSHRQNNNFNKVVDKEAPIDMLIHCGDIEGCEYDIQSKVKCPVEIVPGNNDFFSETPKEKEFYLGKYKVFLTHGHTYLVAMGNETIKAEAKARGADIVMYGHTHKPTIDIEEDIIAINPGSLTYPRQEGRKPSYIVMELLEDTEPHFEIRYL